MCEKGLGLEVVITALGRGRGLRGASHEAASQVEGARHESFIYN
jgi:hypothetical protein